ncbi:uncharacterized protein EI90DRAFT_2612828 [Cantharellus anzutake]|uniref:uncharacterized protein n=1 Tax=Cantharellus anzutake TaxID=1750568 RepID=UPI0019035865|nr:uncharacterized protein EI90DRAFT_2612828 [Cantharellus anzutake]KAF8320176.1 hypothetical protein EI90DRAFT_2612828 [Cantharellus anzutake]
MILEPLALRFEDIANTHSRISKMELLKLVPEEFRSSTTQETLELARTLFVRMWDWSITRYPRLSIPLDRGKWQWDESGSSVMRNIIISAGHDPDTMTFAQLVEEDIWVECITCVQAGCGARVSQPMGAVEHCRKGLHLNIPHNTTIEWRVLEGQELSAARASCAVAREWWQCLLCERKDAGTEDCILQHIALQHPSARPDLQYCYLGSERTMPRKCIPDPMLGHKRDDIGAKG